MTIRRFDVAAVHRAIKMKAYRIVRIEWGGLCICFCISKRLGYLLLIIQVVLHSGGYKRKK